MTNINIPIKGTPGMRWEYVMDDRSGVFFFSLWTLKLFKLSKTGNSVTLPFKSHFCELEFCTVIH